MIQMDLEFNRIIQELGATQQEVEKAIRSTVTKLANRAKTIEIEEIRAVYNIKRSDLTTTGTGKARVQVIPARLGEGTAILKASGRPLAVALFGAKKMNQGVQIGIWKGKITLLGKAFMATMPTGHVGVYYRKVGTGKHEILHNVRRKGGIVQRKEMRQKLTENVFVTIPTLFGGKRIFPKVEEMISEEAPKIFTHELEYSMGKFSK